MTNFFNTPNVITPEDEIMDIDFGFKNDFKLKPYQKATILKLLNHEEKFFITTKMPKKYEEIINDEVSDKYRHNDEITITHNNHIHLDNDNIQLNFHTNIGVLSNNVGSGKTAVVLGLINHKKTMTTKYSYSNYMRELVYDTATFLPRDLTNIIADFHDPSITCQLLTHFDKETECNLINIPEQNEFYIKSNLILVPHNLFLQWKSEIKNITNLKVKCIHSVRDLKFTLEEAQNGYFDEFDIVLCNANKLKHLNGLTDNCVWSRIFIDEVDTINIPSFPELQSYFLWFVSTTYERILTPKNKGFINDLFSVGYTWREDNVNLYKFLLNSITYTCDKDYINQYLKLDTPEYNYIQYESPFINRLLYNLDIKTINRYINSNDFKSIIDYFVGDRYDFDNLLREYFNNDLHSSRYHNYHHIMKENFYIPLSIKQNTMIACLLKLVSQIADSKNRIERKLDELIEYREIIASDNDSWLTEKEAKQRINNINKSCFNTIKKYYELIKKLEYIRNQFVENKVCLFCHSQVNCYNDKKLSCYSCYSNEEHIQLFKNCFYFLDELSTYKRNIYDFMIRLRVDFSKGTLKNNRSGRILKLENIFKYQKPEDICVNSNKEIFNYDVKITKLIELINKDKENKKRVLIFSDSIQFFNQIKSNLEEKEITFRTVKGNGNTINSILRKYKNHEVSVLLLNMKYMGSGLNLQVTDKIYIMNYLDKDTETQVIGRANRYGREGKLSVNYIFYKEECLLYSNKNSSTENSTDDEEVEEISSDSEE